MYVPAGVLPAATLARWASPDGCCHLMGRSHTSRLSPRPLPLSSTVDVWPPQRSAAHRRRRGPQRVYHKVVRRDASRRRARDCGVLPHLQRT